MIPLNTILQIAQPSEFKLHLATRNRDGTEPLDDFVADVNRWRAWNQHRSGENDWSRPFVLSFMRFYSESHASLFGGSWEVVSRRRDGYALRPDPRFSIWEGRVVAIFRPKFQRRRRGLKLETWLPHFSLREILPSVYGGTRFPGCAHVNHAFTALEGVFASEPQDWMATLSDTSAIYLITDYSNGKQYVGSAYGVGGLWARWSVYMQNGHGGNKELRELLAQHGLEYARHHFRFSIVEVLPKTMASQEVIAREEFWKLALGSTSFGYNRN